MTDVIEAFPAVERIEDRTLRDCVVSVWQSTVEGSDFDDLASVPWWPPLEAELDTDGVSTIEHVRDVTAFAESIADGFANRGYPVDRDLVVAGALVHDISKPYELSEASKPGWHDLLPHPHYAVHVLAEAGFPPDIQHIALSHSRSSAVEPRTIEARIVQLADELAVDALYWTHNGTLRSP